MGQYSDRGKLGNVLAEIRCFTSHEMGFTARIAAIGRQDFKVIAWLASFSLRLKLYAVAAGAVLAVSGAVAPGTAPPSRSARAL